mgnify:CR=1 FL=1
MAMDATDGSCTDTDHDCERWAAAGGEDAVAVAARRVQKLLAAHEPPDDLDAVTRRQLDDYCLA